MNYIAILHKEDGSDWGVSFPDFPGCVTAGATIDEAKDNAKEALEFHIQDMKKEGDDIPEASNLESVMKSDDFGDGVLFLVDVVLASKQVRINLTMREDQLDQIDKLAKELGKTRSAYMVERSLIQHG